MLNADDQLKFIELGMLYHIEMLLIAKEKDPMDIAWAENHLRGLQLAYTEKTKEEET